VKDFKLSPHFSFYEMTTTNHRTYLDENRNPPQDTLSNGYALCASLLEPIRVHFGKPVIIHSGYRCPGLNGAIGGSKSSQHMTFQAADFHVNGVDLRKVFEWIWKESDLRWGQLILEGWSVGAPTWIHISLGEPWRDADKSRQVLTFEAGKYTRLQ
jgi:zinc D-Ala-D-Ala carboxypeptidase